jgi:hypothetical protein
VTRRAARGMRAVLSIVVAFALAGGIAASTPLAAGGAKMRKDPSAEDAERQAALVADEDLRLEQIRAAAPRVGQGWRPPFRVDTYGGSTLVLTERAYPYTVDDLLQYGPKTITRQADGAYLLTENLYVNMGARLEFFDENGLTLRLASTRKGFVSVVSYGGIVDLRGTPRAPLRIASWDPLTRGSDADVGDGRAYLRAIGGRFAMSYAVVTDLGFWSGRTGGVGLTGNDLSTSADAGETVQPAAGTQGPAVGDGRFAEPALPGISGSITHATMRRNAFGLFVSNSRDVSIADVRVESSVRDGVVLHRYEARAPVTRVVSWRNGGDGFVLARATQGVRLDRVSAEHNAGNGLTVDGQPLASAPSVFGDSMASYGPNRVSNSVATGNGRYGIEVVGGHGVGLLGNHVDGGGGDMGIVVRAGAADVRVSGNYLTGHKRQGIAVREGASAVQVTQNTVVGGETGIYVRDAVARLERNAVRDVTQHGVTVVGAGAGVVVTRNVIAGKGSRAVDVSRVDGVVDVRDNDASGWHDDRTVWAELRHYVSPMTLLWSLIALVVIGTAVRMRRRGGQWIGEHPYADKLPLRSAPPQEIVPEGRRGDPEIAG